MEQLHEDLILLLLEIERDVHHLSHESRILVERWAQKIAFTPCSNIELAKNRNDWASLLLDQTKRRSFSSPLNIRPDPHTNLQQLPQFLIRHISPSDRSAAWRRIYRYLFTPANADEQSNLSQPANIEQAHPIAESLSDIVNEVKSERMALQTERQQLADERRRLVQQKQFRDKWSIPEREDTPVPVCTSRPVSIPQKPAEQPIAESERKSSDAGELMRKLEQVSRMELAIDLIAQTGERSRKCRSRTCQAKALCHAH